MLLVHYETAGVTFALKQLQCELDRRSCVQRTKRVAISSDDAQTIQKILVT